MKRTVRVTNMGLQEDLRSHWIGIRQQAKPYGVTQAIYNARLLEWALTQKSKMLRSFLGGDSDLPAPDAAPTGAKVPVDFEDSSRATEIMSLLDALVSSVRRSDRRLFQYDVLGAVVALMNAGQLKPPKHLYTTGVTA